MSYFETARKNMITNQVMPNRVNDDKILNALQEVERHQFVDGDWQKVAYFDGRLPLGDNRFMLPPEIFARMVNALDLDGSENVLDIACGTGYSTAILSKLAKKIVGVESVKSLAVKASNTLVFMNLKNISVKNSEIFAGDPSNAPFDAILVNGAVKKVPESLLSQLAEGGKLVAIEDHESGIQKVMRYENIDGTIGCVELFDANAEYL